ncbi:hypothetical protein MBLNU457_7267t1 [Dothideomycetes sp. NU457]
MLTQDCSYDKFSHVEFNKHINIISAFCSHYHLDLTAYLCLYRCVNAADKLNVDDDDFLSHINNFLFERFTFIKPIKHIYDLSASSTATTSASPTSALSSSISSSVSRTSNGTSSAATASASASPVSGASVSNTILIFAVSDSDAYSAYSGLNGYGIPYQVVICPQGGVTLPVLNSSATQGNYGGFIVVSDVSYDYSTGWASALTNDQLTQIYNYQVAFGVRMVRLNSYPQSAYGTSTLDQGCCSSGVEQLVSISNSSGFPTANIKEDAGMTTENLWHYPALITDSSTTWEIASFAQSSDGTSPAGSAAVVNNFAGRQQMVFFISFGTAWSPTSAFLQHAYIHWMTRGLFLGARKIYFNTQIDDMHLSTPMYNNETFRFRIRPADLDAVASWQASINQRLPAGSMYKIEIGHNGNGDIINSTTSSDNICDPDTAIYQISPAAPPVEFVKPLGSGTNIWPTTPANYVWSAACAKVDSVASWFMNPTNRDQFSHLSHTFSHMNLNNATYSDVNKEIFFNQAWLAQVGIAAGDFSPAGLIPPAITGLHNGDAIQAFMDNGLKYVVGDNTRSSLLNQNNNMWPLISTVAANGHDGLVIVPRWATSIYYDCSDAACTTYEWVQTGGGTNSFDALIANEKSQNSFHLLSLSQAPYMFHQANLRTIDVATYTVGAQTAQMSLLQIWVETVTQEMTRLTNWPLVTLPHDVIAQKFVDRMTRDACGANLAYSYSNDGSSITAVTVTANGNSCSVPVPVTVPGGAPSSSGASTSDKVGSEPLIMWVTLSGSPVTLTLPTPVSVSR